MPLLFNSAGNCLCGLVPDDPERATDLFPYSHLILLLAQVEPSHRLTGFSTQALPLQTFVGFSTNAEPLQTLSVLPLVDVA